MKIELIALGNPIVGDDGVGIKVVEEIKKRGNLPHDITIVPDVSTGGIALVELFRGYDKVIIVDAIETGTAKVGAVRKLFVDDYNSALHISDFHNMDFFTALEFSKKIYEDIPSDITVIGIEICNKLEFNDQLSEDIQKQFSHIVNEVESLIINEIKKETVVNV